jgi:hypothetical protein
MKEKKNIYDSPVSWAVYPHRPSRPSTIIDTLSYGTYSHPQLELVPKKCISKEKKDEKKIIRRNRLLGLSLLSLHHR